MKPHQHPSFVPALAGTVALFFASLASLHAANVTLTTSNTQSGQSGFIVGSHWSNNAAPSAGNDYFVNSGFVLRTPQTGAGPITFGGDSLTVTGGALTSANLSSVNVIINNLTLTGGAYINNSTTSTQTISGTLDIAGVTFARLSTASPARSLILASTISGSGSMQVLQFGTLTLTGTGNTFGGTWTVGGSATVGGTLYTNTSTLVSTLDASSADSLGFNSSLVGDNDGIIKIGYDWNTTGSLSLNTGSVLFLDHDLTVGSLSISGVALADGQYDYDFLKTNYADFFNKTGATGGSIIVGVIPEPSSLALLAGGAALLGGIVRRRRCRA